MGKEEESLRRRGGIGVCCWASSVHVVCANDMIDGLLASWPVVG